MSQEHNPQEPEQQDHGRMEALVKEMLTIWGEDPQREGLLKTPSRVARAYGYLTSGYNIDVRKVVNGAIFHEKGHDLVMVKNIKFFSLCEHHIIPFFGQCHIGYVPDGKIIGLSKLARIVDVFAKRLQVQERLTRQIGESIVEMLAPLGVAVVMEASHLCMVMRGVEQYDSITSSSFRAGVFEDDAGRWTEFMTLVRT